MNKYSLSYWVPRLCCRPRGWSASPCRLELNNKGTRVRLYEGRRHTILAAVRHCCVGQGRWIGTGFLFFLFSSMSHMHACFLGSYTDTYTCINNVLPVLTSAWHIQWNLWWHFIILSVLWSWTNLMWLFTMALSSVPFALIFTGSIINVWHINSAFDWL